MKIINTMYIMPLQVVFPYVFSLNKSCTRFAIESKKCIHLSITQYVQLGVMAKKKEMPIIYENQKLVKKNFPVSPSIKLLDMSNKMKVVSLDSAMKIANHRGLKLVKLEDENEHSKSLYKLMMNHMNSDEKDKNALKSGMKREKIFSINANIASFDMNIKLKKMEQLLLKHLELNVTIQATSPDQRDQVEKQFLLIQKCIENKGQINQKQSNNKGLKFRIIPSVNILKDGNST